MIFVLIIIGLYFYYIHNNTETLNINSKKVDDSMEILKQRYVRGEIDDESFERMKKIIKE